MMDLALKFGKNFGFRPNSNILDVGRLRDEALKKFGGDHEFSFSVGTCIPKLSIQCEQPIPTRQYDGSGLSDSPLSCCRREAFAQRPDANAAGAAQSAREPVRLSSERAKPDSCEANAPRTA